MTGLFRGAVGLITKPAAGLLDFTSGLTGAVSNVLKEDRSPRRSRPPRCCFDAAGLLPPFNQHYAEAQQLLFDINSGDYKEMSVVLISTSAHCFEKIATSDVFSCHRFIALEDLRDISADCLQALISTEKVYLLGHEDGHQRPMLSFVYKEIFCCRCIPESKCCGPILLFYTITCSSLIEICRREVLH